MCESKYLDIFKQVLTEKAANMCCSVCLGKVSLLKNLREVKCTTKNCRKVFPVTTSPLFYKSKLNNDKILRIIQHLKLYVATNAICELLEVNKNTVCRIRKKITTLLYKDFITKGLVIGGEEIVVEVDETKMGRRKYNKGHKVDGVWILGMVEKTTQRRIIAVPVEKRDTGTLNRKILQFVHPGSIIHTDKWKGYTDLEKVGYKHYVVNHSKHFKDPETGIHTNTIEGNWSGLKVKVPKRYRTKELIHFYLLSYMLKRNYNVDLVEYLIKLL
jgi:ISXO2-like transposase domain